MAAHIVWGKYTPNQNITSPTNNPSTSPSSSPTPTYDPAAAQAQGEAAADQFANQSATSAQGSQAVQSSNYDSLYKSSVDNMMNGQMGQATATIMSGSLAKEASQQSGSCDVRTQNGAAACTAAGLLVGMATLANGAATSFDTPIQTAWSNVCEFSAIGCGATVPNPYTVVAGPSGGLTSQIIPGVTEILHNNGYTVNPNTGVVKTNTGKLVNPNDSQSLKDALGEGKAQSLMSTVSGFEKEALARVKSVKRSLYEKALGLGFFNGHSEIARPSDDSSKQEDAMRAAKLKAQPRPIFRRPSTVDGYFKMYNGEPIGIAADSIFVIVTRRYQIKVQDKTLYSPLETEKRR